MVTVAGGGLLLAKNCAIMWLRKALKPTRPPTRSVSESPIMMNQRSIRTGRGRGLSAIGSPARWGSVTMFMSGAFCSCRLLRIRRQFPVQMRSNCGFVKSDSPEEKLAKLPFQIGRIAVRQAGHGRQPRQCRHQHGVMGEPEQVERLGSDPRSIACHHRAIERGDEYRRDQVADLGIEQSREFTVIEMAGG